MSKFGSLSSGMAASYRVKLIDPLTDMPLKDKDGAQAYIDVQSAQSETGRSFDRMRQQASLSRMNLGTVVEDEADPLKQNAEKLAALTVGWHLVDPVTKEALDVECSREAAAELYILPHAYPFYLQGWVAAHRSGNFMKGSSDVS